MRARAMQYIKEVVAFGPRPIGSANHKKLEEYIHAHLKGDLVEDDYFTADTPAGKLPVRNIIAKFPGTRDGIIVIARPLRHQLSRCGTKASSAPTTAALRPRCCWNWPTSCVVKKRDGYSVWLLWTDGEEAVQQWSGRPTASTGRASWPRNGRKTAPSRRSRLFCWWT